MFEPKRAYKQRQFKSWRVTRLNVGGSRPTGNTPNLLKARRVAAAGLLFRRGAAQRRSGSTAASVIVLWEFLDVVTMAEHVGSAELLKVVKDL